MWVLYRGQVPGHQVTKEKYNCHYYLYFQVKVSQWKLPSTHRLTKQLLNKLHPNDVNTARAPHLLPNQLMQSQRPPSTWLMSLAELNGVYNLPISSCASLSHAFSLSGALKGDNMLNYKVISLRGTHKSSKSKQGLYFLWAQVSF